MNDSLMLATIRDDTWNVPNMQHISHHAKKQPIEAERTPMAYFTEEVNPSLAKPQLKFNGGLTKPESTSLVK